MPKRTDLQSTLIPGAGPIGAVPYTLVGGGNVVRYTPNTGFSGPDSFTFKANDGTYDSNTATVSVEVVPVLSLPFIDTFPATTFDGGKWALVSNATIDDVGINEPSPPFSARFNGGSYPERFAAIYRMLRERSVDGSPARFVCALAVADGDAIVFEATGTVEGRIAPHPAGEEGFGYDPIFFYPPFGCTLAEVSRDRKASVSHRGQAFRQLRVFLERSVLELPRIYINGGRRGFLLGMPPAELVRTLQPTLVDVALED